ncbi:MAG: hypothetical protein H7Y38_13865 [Armatimonadetes bacterium]|nr:hypothetical protein [Armatimonadota bacterium]
MTKMIAALCALLLFCAAANAAPMRGQAVPSAATAKDAARFSQAVLRGGGGEREARAQLSVLVETNATADLTETFAPALRDLVTYTTVLATYDDVLQNETDAAKQTFIRFNILRTIVERAAFLPTTSRRAMLTRATNLAETLAKENKADAAVWESNGDLYALQGDTATSESAYKRMASLDPAASARAGRKTGEAYQSVRNYGKARTAFESGIRADAASGGGKREKHLLYQAIASLSLAEGNTQGAIDALALSGSAKPDATTPYSFRLDVAEALLKRGYAKQVREFAVRALEITPGDPAATDLLARTK